MADPTVDQYTSPLKKLVRFFKNSRDQWKAKHHELQKQIKRFKNQTRAVEHSRQHWRTTAEHAQAQVKQLQQEIEELKRRPPQ